MEMNNRANADYMLRKAMLRTETPDDELLNKIRNNTIRERPAARTLYRSRRILVAAAVAVTLIAFSTAAIATNFFGLRDMALPGLKPGDQYLGIPITEEMFNNPEYAWLLRPDFSMQGFEGSPEYAAAAEWRAFEYGYDTDGILREAVGNTWGGIPEPYWYYGAFTMEMVEKIREITEKYGLSLMGDLIDTRTPEEFHSLISNGPLFKDDSILTNGSVYESGTFKLEGDYGEIPFYMRSSRKGVFDWVSMSGFDEISGYNEWAYENAFGKQLLLIQGANSSVIILDTEVAFNVVILYVGTEGNEKWVTALPPFSHADLEHFADLIDFGQLRTELSGPEFISALEAKRNEMDAAVSGIFGVWTHVKSESADGTGLPEYVAEGLKIYENRRIYLWHGEGMLEHHENWSADFVWDHLTYWEMEGDAVSVGDDDYDIDFSGLTGPFGDDFLARFDSESMRLNYDSESQLLRFTDWDGNFHFYKRAE